MRGLGLTKGFDKSRVHGWFIRVRQSDGNRPKQYFATQKERDRAFNAKVKDVRSVGADASGDVSALDRQFLVEMKALSEPTGLIYREIFQRGLEQVDGALTTKKLTATQAAIIFKSEQKTRQAENKITHRREQEVRTILDRFLAINGNRALPFCNRKIVKTYLTELGVGPQTRINHARVLSFFFGWCETEGLITRNPVPDQEGVDRIPAVFTNDQVDALFARAWDGYPELIPMLLVQWYAGLRPGATHHLNWEKIDFERGRILIQPHGNKLKQPDIVQDIPLTVFALLTPLRHAKGPLVPTNHVKLTQRLHHDLGYHGKGKHRWPEDVARHTFASNLLPFYDLDMKRVDAVLLHTTSAMLKKHYLLKNIPREVAEIYFTRGLPFVSAASSA